MMVARVLLARLSVLIVAACLIGLVSAPSAGAYIYWGNPLPDPAIGRASSDGSAKDSRFIEGFGRNITGLALDTEHLYWTHSRASGFGPDVIARADLDGGRLDSAFLTPPRDAGFSVIRPATDDHHIYWASHYGGQYVIGRANLNGTGVTPGFIALPQDNYAFSIASSGNHIYWSVNDPDEDSSIGRADADGDDINTEFIAGFGNGSDGGRFVNDVAVANGKLYWCASGQIGRADLDGTNIVRELVDTGCWGLAVDSEHIYWGYGVGDESLGSIARAKLDGSGVEPRFIPGATSAQVEGLAVNTPELGLEVDPKRQRVTRGSTTKATVSVANTGDTTMNNLEVSTELRMKKPHPKRARRRVEVPSGWEIGSLSEGETETHAARVRMGRRAFRGRYKIAFILDADDVDSTLARTKLRIRFKKR